MTTYGTWLRGDARGWVDGGIVFPAAPALEAADRRRMKHPTFRFEADQWWQIGQWIGTSLQDRLAVRVWAMTVQTWHVHVVVGATAHPVGRVVKCAKDAVRWGLRPGRPTGQTVGVPPPPESPAGSFPEGGEQARRQVKSASEKNRNCLQPLAEGYAVVHGVEKLEWLGRRESGANEGIPKQGAET